MKNRYIGPAICVAVLAVGLGLFALLRANYSGTVPASPAAGALTTTGTSTTIAGLTKPGATPQDQATTINQPTVEAALPGSTYYSSTLAPTATAWAEGWTTFVGQYFTMQVAPFWKDVSDQVPASWNGGQYSTVMEDTAWRIDGVNGAYVQVQALYEPYSDLLTSADYTPFQAGNLKGETSTDSSTATVEIVLPGAPDNSAAVSFKASLVMPTTLPQDIQDILSRQFREAVALLTPSQKALQGTPTAVPAPPGVQACSATSLYASVDGQGCTGFFCGEITLTNTGPTACSLHGRPIMKYISLDGKSLPVAQFDQTPPSGNADSALVLKPGGRAQLLVRRSIGSGCSAQERVSIPASWVMELPGIAGTVPLMGNSTFDVCRSSLPTVMSIEVGTFELEK
jgi:hypothetical protein